MEFTLTIQIEDALLQSILKCKHAELESFRPHLLERLEGYIERGLSIIPVEILSR